MYLQPRPLARTPGAYIQMQTQSLLWVCDVISNVYMTSLSSCPSQPKSGPPLRVLIPADGSSIDATGQAKSLGVIFDSSFSLPPISNLSTNRKLSLGSLSLGSLLPTCTPSLQSSPPSSHRAATVASSLASQPPPFPGVFSQHSIQGCSLP